MLGRTPAARPPWRRRLLIISLAVLTALGPIFAGFHEAPNLLQIVATAMTVIVAVLVVVLGPATPPVADFKKT